MRTNIDTSTDRNSYLALIGPPKSARTIEAEHWSTMARSLQPTLFLTLVFLAPEYKMGRIGEPLKSTISDKQALGTANELLKRLNRNLYGRQKRNYLEGIGCIEYQKSGQPHFHILIRNEIDKTLLVKTISHILDNARKAYLLLKKKSKLYLIDENSLKIETIISKKDQSDVSDYLIKHFRKAPSNERMLILSKDGLMD